MKIIDIETVPQPNIMDTWFPAWAEKKMPNASREEIERSASLHAEFGMVCAIGIADPGCAPMHTLARSLEEESQALKDLAGAILANEILVGHNIKNLTFLLPGSSIRLGHTLKAMCITLALFGTNFGGLQFRLPAL